MVKYQQKARHSVIMVPDRGSVRRFGEEHLLLSESNQSSIESVVD